MKNLSTFLSPFKSNLNTSIPTKTIPKTIIIAGIKFKDAFLFNAMPIKAPISNNAEVARSFTLIPLSNN